jgi:hypothetical protein
VSPGWSRLLSRAVAQRGRGFLEAPIEEREAYYASLTPGPAGEPLWRSDLYTAPKAVPAPAPPPAPPLADDELLLVTTTAG